MGKSGKNTLSSVLHKRWITFLEFRRLCLENDSVDNVHDLRVSCRRLRAALQLIGSIGLKKDVANINPVIRRVTRDIGVLRNLDEALLFIRRECNGEDQFSELAETIGLQRRKEAVRMHRHLKRLDTKDISRFVDKMVTHLSDNRFKQSRSALTGFLSDANMGMYLQVNLLLPHLLDENAPEKRHALRIAIKRWRYFLEIVAELVHRDYDRFLEDLKEYQTILGQLNDLRVFSDYAAQSSMGAVERGLFQSVVDSKGAECLAGLSHLADNRPLKYLFLV